MRPFVPVWLLAALLLGGCTGGNGAPNATPSGPASFGDEAIPDAATITGLVVDDSQQPIAGASVGITALNLVLTTDEAGAFTLANLPPGDHVLHVAALGYEPIAQKVSLAPSEERRLMLVLATIEVATPYHDTFGPWAGQFECQLGTPEVITSCTGDNLHGENVNDVVFPSDKRRMPHTLSANEWETIVGEARWGRGTFATSQGMAIFNSFEKRDGTEWWCEADGQSPIQFRQERTLESVCTSSRDDSTPAMKHNPLIVIADPGYAGTSAENPPLRLLLQHKFEIMVTIFYHEPAPAGYTGFADA